MTRLSGRSKVLARTLLLLVTGTIACFINSATIAQGPSSPKAGHTIPLRDHCQIVGADCVTNLMAHLMDCHERNGVTCRLSLGRTGGNPSNALMSGNAKLVYMTRALTAAETKDFMRSHGHSPIEVLVATQRVTLVVHIDNPVAKIGLKVSDLKQLYTGDGKESVTWGDLGIDDPAWKHNAVRVYSPGRQTGSALLFRDLVAKGATLSPSVTHVPHSPDVVTAVRSDRDALGFCDELMPEATVSVVPIAVDHASTPTYPSSVKGAYPLSRPIYCYVNHDVADPCVSECLRFTRYILSPQGQRIVGQNGFVPLSGEAVGQERLKVERHVPGGRPPAP